MTDTTDPTKPVAWRAKGAKMNNLVSHRQNQTFTEPLYDASLLSEYERATARSEALEAENKRLREALENAHNLAKGCEHDGGFDREIGPIGCMLGDKCVCMGFATVLREALETIADPKKLPSRCRRMETRRFCAKLPAPLWRLPDDT